MPRETIWGTNCQGTDPKASDFVPQINTSVMWNKGAEYVQISTTRTDYDTGYFVVDGDGWFADLDRNQIQQLIRTLRRARDQVFGKDE